MSSNRSESQIKNSVWYQQHLEKLKIKRKQDAESETQNSVNISTTQSSGKNTVKTLLEKSAAVKDDWSSLLQPKKNDIKAGKMVRESTKPDGSTVQDEKLVQEKQTVLSEQSTPLTKSNSTSIMTSTPVAKDQPLAKIDTERQIEMVLSKINMKSTHVAKDQPHTKLDTERQIEMVLSKINKKSTPVAKDQPLTKLDTERQIEMVLSKINKKSTPVAKGQPLTKVDTERQIKMVLSEINKKSTPVAKVQPLTKVDTERQIELVLSKINMKSTHVAKDQPLTKVDIKSQIEMVLSKINNKLNAEKSDTYLEHKKKLQEQALLQKKPESEIEKLGASVSNALDKPQSNAYLEHLKKLQAKNRTNDEPSSLTGHQPAKPTQVTSSATHKASRVSMQRPEHLKPSQVYFSAGTTVASTPTSSEKTGIDKAAPITIKKELPPCSGWQRPTTAGAQFSDEKTASIKVTPMQIKKEALPYSMTQPSPTVDKRSQQNPHSAKQATPIRTSPRGQLATGSRWGPSLVDDAPSCVRTSPRRQQATTWGPSLVDSAPSCSSRVQSEPTRHLSISGEEDFLTLDSTFAEDSNEKKNSWTTQRPKSSDFFENSTNRVKTNEQKSSSVAKPSLRSILKRTQNDSETATIPAKTQRCDSKTRVKPNLPSLEPDAIEVIPSSPQDSQHHDANMRNDNASAAGVDFIQPVSGYHCVLCNTFYHHYSTALHHCTLLTHKMKTQKAESVKNTFKQV